VIRKQLRDILVAQALNEIQFARTYKQGAVWRWHETENQFYQRKYGTDGRQNTVDDRNIGSQNNLESRANVNLGKMRSFVRSLLAKIDTPLTFIYKRGSIADLKKAMLLNALKERDANIGNWNYKDLSGKMQVIMYDRAIFSYHADSMKGYQSHLENVDVYDFLIDPSGGGIDIDMALYCGRFGVRKTKQQLKAGVKDGEYIRTEADRLIAGAGNLASTTPQEEINKENRYSYIGSPANRTLTDTNIYKFWEWYTTYENKRYYLLLNEDGGVAVRVCELTDIFREDPILGDAPWPFWTYSTLPDLTEFWTPSYTDGVSEVFMGQSVSINQMLDNADRINKPQRKVDVSSIENLADLVYRRNGIIRFKPGRDVNTAFQIVETPSIDTPLKVYDKLEQIQQMESGVTAASKGSSDEDKVGIYEGNLAQMSDNYGLLNKSYSEGYKRFAKLYWYGIEDHLTKKVAVKILGPKGLEKTVFVGKRDIKPQSDYEVLVESSNAESQGDNVEKRNKLTFLGMYRGNPIVNQKVLFENEATIAGFADDEIRSMLDVQDAGTAMVISEAERDIEELLNGKIIEPNMTANAAYANHLLDYMKDHQEDMDEDTFMLFVDYMERIQPVIMRNMATQLTNNLAKEGMRDMAGAPLEVPPEEQALELPPEQQTQDQAAPQVALTAS
jgi:hypothetical protein